MNCGPPDQLPPQAAFLNLNWDQSMDSALSSIVTSPAESNSAAAENLRLHNLIAASAAEIPPQSHYMSSTPLKLNLSTMASQFHHQYPNTHNGMQILENLMPMGHHLDKLLVDPAFTERAARLSCFDSQSYAVPAQLFGLPENTRDESSVSDPASATAPQTESNAKKRKAAVAKGKGKESSLSSSTPKDPNKEENAKKCKSAESNGVEKADQNGSLSTDNDNNGSNKQSGGKDSSSKIPEPPKDYIHVRARRGEATDSHSLAERVRREKISQRMQLLQDLVPGCNKVVGKAVMLDEIINYVQSLQRQVEFLSMKLATVNPQLDFNNLPNIFPKDMQQSCGSLLNSTFPLETSGTPLPYLSQPHQGNPMNCSVTNGMEAQSSVHPLDQAFYRSMGGHHPFLNGVSDAASQVGTFWQDDQMDIGQNQEIATSSQSFNGSLQTVHMKMEL